MDALLDRLERWASGRNILLLGVCLGAFYVAIFPAFLEKIPSSPDLGLLDVLPGYTPEDAYSRLEAYGPEGRRVYAVVEMTVDVAFPIVTALLLSLFTLFALGCAFPRRRALRALALVPLGTLVADLAENAAILGLLFAYPSRIEPLARLSSLLTTAKWSLVVSSVAVALGVACCALARRLFPGPPHEPGGT